MSMDTIPIGIFFVATTLLVVIAIEVGYRVGRTAHRSSEEEKESPVSAIAGTILGLLAFILAFTFAIVSDRYDARKGLVRDEANAIRTAYSRSEFLPEPDRAEATALLREYEGRPPGRGPAGRPREVARSADRGGPGPAPTVGYGGRECPQGYEFGCGCPVH